MTREDMRPSAEAPIDAGQRLDVVLEDLVSRGSLRVPPYPAAAMKVQEVLARHDYTTAQLVGAMKADAVFTGALLRLANSPFYRRGGEVTSLAVAVQRIGPKELGRLAMASALSGLVRAGGPLHVLRRRLWRAALSSALVAEALAHLEGGEEGDAFVAGLLHDAGKLVVVGAIEALWLEGVASEGGEAEARAALERYHVRAGEALAERWKLPGLFGAVIATHHDERGTLGPLTHKVVLADAVVQLMEEQPDVEPRDLERVGVAPAFAVPLANVLPKVPPTLAAFEGPREPAGTELRAVPRPDSAYVVEVTGESAGPWPVARAREGALEVLAPRALAESLLLEVTVDPGLLRLWVLVGRSERTGQAFITELIPYGLGAQEAVRWRALVAELRRREAA